MSDDTRTGAPSGAPEATLVPEAEEILAAGKSAEADLLDVMRRENEDLRQQMLRALAEAENVRRRAQRDVSDARQYAVTSFARDLLNVADNFHRAMQAMDAATGEVAPELKGVLDGIHMTERELSAVFERHGIKPIDPAGQRFDPNKHQAVYEVEDASVAAGTVVQVMQLGSMIGERVLRPAMVAVSRGGPKPGEATGDGDGAAA